MSVRIATFNLKDFFAPRRDEERAVVEAKLANVAREIERARPDVIALQEVGSTELLDRLVAALPRLRFGAPMVGTPDKRGIRCAILTRFPILWAQVHTAEGLPFPRFAEGDPDPFPKRIPLRRGVVHVRVDAEDLGEIDVLTVHFKSGRPAFLRATDGSSVLPKSAREWGEAMARSMVLRIAESLHVRGLVDDVLATLPDHAVCVLGDFNDRIEAAPVRVLLGEGDGRLTPCAELLPDEQRYSCFHDDEPSLIDHILVTPRLRAALDAITIQHESLRFHGPPLDDVPLTEDSDHALVVAEFKAT